MKQHRMFCILLAMLFLCLPLTGALAEADGADKNATVSEEEAEKYSVSLRVPGTDNDKRHDEIIIMVDGSYSVDNEWPHMKAAILEIAKLVLNGKNDMRITLMAFGMGPNTVAEHISSVSALEALLNTYQGNLLYGRSSTNIEGAMLGIQRYLAAHDADSLKDAFVIFLTDGGVNQHAAKNQWLTVTAPSFNHTQDYATMIRYELQAVLAGDAVISEETKTVFTESEIEQLLQAVRTNNAATITNIVSQQDADGTVKGYKWTNLVFANVYAYHNMSDAAGGYSICDMERATLDYQKAKGTFIENAFYYVAARKGNISGQESVNQKRAIEAMQTLAADPTFRVTDLYLLQYGNDFRAKWMQFKDASGKQYDKPENVTYISAASIRDLAEAIRKKLAVLAETAFSETSVEDYTSKWVRLLPETLCILDAEDRVIAAYDPEASDPAAEKYVYRWLTDAPPFRNRAPIVLEVVPPAEYPDDPAVKGNTSGKIYRITWNVKEETLLRTDAYRMRYDILVDTEEKGFSYSAAYPANGNTLLRYRDRNGNLKEEAIAVPEVCLIEDAAIPETGDSMQLFLWAALLLGALFGLAWNKRGAAER